MSLAAVVAMADARDESIPITLAAAAFFKESWMRKIAALFAVLVLAVPVMAEQEITMTEAGEIRPGVVYGQGTFVIPPAGTTWYVWMGVYTMDGTLVNDKWASLNGTIWECSVPGIPAGEYMVTAWIEVLYNGVWNSYPSNTINVTVQ